MGIVLVFAMFSRVLSYHFLCKFKCCESRVLIATVGCYRKGWGAFISYVALPGLMLFALTHRYEV